MPAYISAIWLFLALLGQTAPPPENAPTQGKLMTFRELLQQRHIELTTASLVQALKNPDDRVRYLAALVLAEDKSTEAVPQIESALKSEKVPETKVNMALALAQFGDQDGFAALKTACDDRGTPASIRLYAAVYMLDLDNESCLSAVLEVLQSKGGLSVRILALSQLGRLHNVSDSDIQRIRSAVANALKDSMPDVRIAASDTLARLGGQNEIGVLEDAVRKESDEMVRSQMESGLKRLREKIGD